MLWSFHNTSQLPKWTRLHDVDNMSLLLRQVQAHYTSARSHGGRFSEFVLNHFSELLNQNVGKFLKSNFCFHVRAFLFKMRESC